MEVNHAFIGLRVACPRLYPGGQKSWYNFLKYGKCNFILSGLEDSFSPSLNHDLQHESLSRTK